MLDMAISTDSKCVFVACSDRHVLMYHTGSEHTCSFFCKLLVDVSGSRHFNRRAPGLLPALFGALRYCTSSNFSQSFCRCVSRRSSSFVGHEELEKCDRQLQWLRGPVEEEALKHRLGVRQCRCDRRGRGNRTFESRH